MTAAPSNPRRLNRVMIRFHEAAWPTTTIADDAQFDCMRAEAKRRRALGYPVVDIAVFTG